MVSMHSDVIHLLESVLYIVQLLYVLVSVIIIMVSCVEPSNEIVLMTWAVNCA